MCNNHQDKQYKYYREDFGNAPVETVYMDLLFDMEEKSTKVKSIQTLKVLEESLKEIRFDAWDVEINSIKINNTSLEFNYNKDERFVMISLDKEYKKDESFQIEVNNLTFPTDNILEGLYYDTTPKGCPSHQITQCQQWGFRRLVPCVDDMTTKCTYKTTIIADKRYTNLITNGDVKFERKTLENGKDQIVYTNDRVPMATYLFFLGVGTWETYTREFEYPNGHKFELELLLKPNTATPEEAKKSLEVTADGIMYINLFTGRDKYKNTQVSKEVYALIRERDILKSQGESQELEVLRLKIKDLIKGKTLGYQYTGTVYREIAMENTNIGGMENVGNTTVRSDSIVPYKYMADRGIEYLFMVKAHEFYHNLNGSEVTGKTPFEFWLNEAVTVMIETEYSDFTFGTDYNRLSTVQGIIAPVDGVLAQDDGALTKAIEPEGFNHPDELVNSIIYVKSVEFVRMVSLILGKEKFVNALADYHKKFQYSNALSSDWLDAMQKYTHENIHAFAETWLKNTGYPIVKFKSTYDESSKTFIMNLEQRPSNSRDKEDKVWQYPFKYALIDENGKTISSQIYLAKNKKETIVLQNIQSKPAFVSVNRDFSFYGRVERDTCEEELYLQAETDSDPVAKNLAFTEIAEINKMRLMEQLLDGVDKKQLVVNERFVDLYFNNFSNLNNQESLGTRSLAVFEGLYDNTLGHKYEETYQISKAISRAVGKKYESELLEIYLKVKDRKFEGDFVSSTSARIKNRSVKNLALSLYAKNNSQESWEIVKKEYYNSDNFTDKLNAFNIYLNTLAKDKEELIQAFIKDFDTSSSSHFLARKGFLFSLARIESNDVLDIINKYTFQDESFDWNLSNNQLMLVVFAYNRRKSMLRQDGVDFMEKVLYKIAPINDYTTQHFLDIFSDMEHIPKSKQIKIKEMLSRVQDTLDKKKNFATYNNIDILLKN